MSPKLHDLPERRCRRCAYCLENLTTTTCPECGQPFDPDDPKLRERQSPRDVVIGIIAISFVLLVVITGYAILLLESPMSWW